MPNSKLTEKQRLFVAEYLVDLNATQAAIRAGYSQKNADKIGSQLLGKTRVAEAVAAAMDKRAAEVKVTQDYVLNNLVEVVERCLQRRPVMNMSGKQIQDKDGNHLWTFNANGANKALESLGRHLGMFNDKLNTNLNGAITIEWEKDD
jgi:Phage terminase, small subunit